LSSLSSRETAVSQPLFTRLVRYLCCSHWQIAERALSFFANENVSKLLVRTRTWTIPLLFAPLRGNWQ
jgi:hypothetical protein